MHRWNRVAACLVSIAVFGAGLAADDTAAGQPRPSPQPRHALQVWLSGIDPVIAAMTHQAGALDWMDLFAPGSPWPQAGRRVDVFFVATQFFDHATRGSAPDRTDREWTREAVQVIAQARNAGSGEPDDIVLQTYNPHPARMLPESDPAAMTWIVRQAFPP